jgi:hypothetical protein
LEKLCKRFGVKFEFLPPYSPDFNPIEESFSELKAWCKRNRELVDSYENFKDFLDLGMETCGCNAAGHFWSCQIAVPQFLPKTHRSRSLRAQREMIDQEVESPSMQAYENWGLVDEFGFDDSEDDSEDDFCWADDDVDNAFEAYGR